MMMSVGAPILQYIVQVKEMLQKKVAFPFWFFANNLLGTSNLSENVL